MYIVWGSGRARCCRCEKKIRKTKLQVVYRGYRQSAYAHLDCLIADGTRYLNDQLKKGKVSIDTLMTIAEMKAYIEKGGGKNVCTPKLGTKVREDAGKVTAKVPCQNCGTETLAEVKACT